MNIHDLRKFSYVSWVIVMVCDPTIVIIIMRCLSVCLQYPAMTFFLWIRVKYRFEVFTIFAVKEWCCRLQMGVKLVQTSVNTSTLLLPIWKHQHTFTYEQMPSVDHSALHFHAWKVYKGSHHWLLLLKHDGNLGQFLAPPCTRNANHCSRLGIL